MPDLKYNAQDFEPVEQPQRQVTVAFNPDEFDIVTSPDNAPSLSPDVPAELSLPQWAKDDPYLYHTVTAFREAGYPILEAALTTAGTAFGALSSPATGPFGPIAGGGLGYAGAKQIERSADELAGLAAPLRSDMEQNVQDTALGVAFGLTPTVVSPVINVGAKIAGKVMDLGQLAKVKAAKIARATTNGKLPEVLNRLRHAPPNVTASQAIANRVNLDTGRSVVNAPVTQAMLRDAEQRASTQISDLRNAQDVVRQNNLSRMAQGVTQTESLTGRNAARAEMRNRLIPELNTELQAADEAGQRLPRMQERIDTFNRVARSRVNDTTQFMAMNQTAGQLERDTATFEQYLADSLESHGLHPLRAAPILDEIRTIARDPEIARNEDILNDIARSIENWTDGNGIISARALDSLRKDAINSAIEQLRPGSDQTSKKKLSALILGRVKPIIINAIENAGGTGYSQWLRNWEAGMNEISRTKLGAELLRMYKGSMSKKEFLDVVTGNAPEKVEKILGPGRYDIGRELGERAAGQLRQMAAQVMRDRDIMRQATEGSQELNLLLEEHFKKFPMPNWFSRWVSAAHGVRNVLEEHVSGKIMKHLADAAKSARSFEELLRLLPASERVEVLRGLGQFKANLPAGAVGTFERGVTNYLNSPQEPMEAQ